MKYDLAIKAEKKQAFSQFTTLANKKAKIELKRIVPRRTLSQNSYLHLIIGAFGNHFGYTLEEAKVIYKEINRAIYGYEKKGRTFYRSSADLDKEEMAATIDKFREESKKAGCELPLATDLAWLRAIENEIEHSKYYLR